MNWIAVGYMIEYNIMMSFDPCSRPLLVGQGSVVVVLF